jgi:DNA-binding response OmpR family regulator
MPKILIVEDDPAVRDLLKHLFAAEGMKAIAVQDGEEALKRLGSEEGPFDFVILDLILPGVDGARVCQEIRQGGAGSENKDLPVLMLTVRNNEMSVVEGLEVGADDYITKPFKPTELLSRVRAHLRRRRRGAAMNNYEADGHRKGWKRYIAAERHHLMLRVNGLLFWMFSAPVPGAVESMEELHQMAEEDQRLAQEGLVQLLGENYETSYKHIDELAPEDVPARLRAETKLLEFYREGRKRRYGDASSRHVPTPPWHSDQ